MDAAYLKNKAHRVNEFLSHYLQCIEVNDPNLHQAMSYGLLLGGKRVRPFLVYAVGEMFGAQPQALDYVAGSVEAIHAYSLIHDDLPAMDDDALRRGQPTCHIKFDEATAILAGDALQTLAFELLSDAPLKPSQQVQMIKTLARASGYQGMCGGQALDIAATNKHISLTELEQIHRHKTGALIEAAVELGAIAANASEQHRQALRVFAKNIGLAFQVHDDILDIISDTETLGKPQGSDEAANKSTYPALMGLEQAQKKASILIDQATTALDTLPVDSQQLKDFAQYIILRKQ